MRVLSVTLLALLATIFLGASLAVALPGNFALIALWITIAIPLIWAGLIFYCYWDPKAWRVASVLTLTTLVCASIVVLMPTTV